MKTSEKLEEAFHKFRPHINGHNTAMDLFFQALREVKELESKAENLPMSDVSDLLPYLDEIKERIVYRLQQEFPNAHDLVKSIVEDQFENIDNKVVGNSR